MLVGVLKPDLVCTGAGRKIIRCEVSLDGAKTWQLADIQRAAPPNAYGKHWAWVHWVLKMPIRKPPLPMIDLGQLGTHL